MAFRIRTKILLKVEYVGSCEGTIRTREVCTVFGLHLGFYSLPKKAFRKGQTRKKFELFTVFAIEK